LSVLDTSKTPYEWSTPIVENPIGLILSGHTSTIVKNFMITAFGKYNLINFLHNNKICKVIFFSFIFEGKNASNPSDSDDIFDIKDKNRNVYKLDISDPLKYKWSIFIKNDGDTPTSTGTNPIQTNASDSTFASKFRLIIIIIIIVVLIIGVTIFSFYKIKQYRSKNSNKPNISSNDELEKNLN
jgi:hypothetical protein